MAAAKDLGLRGEQAERVRKRVAEVAQRALEKLSEELEIYRPTKTKTSRRRTNYTLEDIAVNGVPVDWVDRFAKIADQLRRDYVIDESASAESEPESQPELAPADRLKRLKVV